MTRHRSPVRGGSSARRPRPLDVVAAMLVAVSPLAAECPPAAAPRLDEEQCAALLRDGEVFVTYRLDDGSKDTRGIAAMVLSSPPEAVWEVITDNENFEQFLCSVADSEFDPASGVNRQVLKIPFWVDLEYRVRIDNSIEGDGADRRWRSAWTYVDGALDDTEGSWLLSPHEGGTLLLYEVRTDPGFGRRWIYTPSRAESELRKLLADVAARVADPSHTCP